MSSTTATILRNSKSSQRKRYDHAISLIYQPCCSVRFGRTTVVVVTFSQNCATSLMRCCSLSRSSSPFAHNLDAGHVAVLVSSHALPASAFPPPVDLTHPCWGGVIGFDLFLFLVARLCSRSSLVAPFPPMIFIVNASPQQSHGSHWFVVALHFPSRFARFGDGYAKGRLQT